MVLDPTPPVDPPLPRGIENFRGVSKDVQSLGDPSNFTQIFQNTSHKNVSFLGKAPESQPRVGGGGPNPPPLPVNKTNGHLIPYQQGGGNFGRGQGHVYSNAPAESAGRLTWPPTDRGHVPGWGIAALCCAMKPSGTEPGVEPGQFLTPDTR